MSKLAPKGSPSERLWLLAEAPLPKDRDKGFLFSSPMGWSYDKMLGEAGLGSYYCTYVDPSDGPNNLVDRINHYQPPIIVALDTAGKHLLPQIKSIESVNLWAGSLLTSEQFKHSHYIIPTFGPETCVKDWTERQIVKSIDLGKVKDELDYWHGHNYMQPLRARKLDIDLPFEQLLFTLWRWKQDKSVKYLSIDIETVYPREKSEFYGHPGYPVTIGIAISPDYGVSFSLFQEDTKQSVRLWKELALLIQEKEVIGQNFFGFDSWFFSMLGIPIDLFKLHDTMFMHAILWPELSHKLQFLTRQYTRQPYYKSEGHGWDIKNLKGLKKYNALDVTVTYEVFLAMQDELKKRPHLI
jgi:hypothetical protein